MQDAVTFGLAFAAYVLLGAGVVLQLWRRPPRVLTLAAAGLALVHVLLVWGWRFDWSTEMALAKGWTGFTIFHTALGVLLAAAVAPQPWSGRCTLAAFPIVSAGAIGAAFRYDFVGDYRMPLLAVLAATCAAGLWAWQHKTPPLHRNE